MSWRHRQFFGDGPLHQSGCGLVLLIPLYGLIALTAVGLVIVALK